MKINSFEHACKLAKINPKKLPIVKDIPREFQKDIIARYKLMVIIKEVNKIANNGKKWTPIWKYGNDKYAPYFWLEKCPSNPSGFSYANSGYDFTNSLTFVGSRLCYKEYDDAVYYGKKFIKLYKDLLK